MLTLLLGAEVNKDRKLDTGRRLITSYETGLSSEYH